MENQDTLVKHINATRSMTVDKITVDNYKEARKYAQLNRAKIIKDLEDYANDFLFLNFNTRLEIPLKINGRLKKSLGRFRSYPSLVCDEVWVDCHDKHVKKGVAVDIELSMDIIVDSLLTDNKNLYGTLKHELVHYALFKAGLPYKDGHECFENKLKELGIPSTTSTRCIGLFHLYACENGHEHLRHNKINPNRYACNCHAKLTYKGQVVDY